jgi:hypothetical protein
MDKFEEFRSNFCIARKRFEEAGILEERQQLVAIPQQIVKAAEGEIEESRLMYLVRRTSWVLDGYCGRFCSPVAP